MLLCHKHQYIETTDYTTDCLDYTKAIRQPPSSLYQHKLQSKSRGWTPSTQSSPALEMEMPLPNRCRAVRCRMNLCERFCLTLSTKHLNSIFRIWTDLYVTYIRPISDLYLTYTIFYMYYFLFDAKMCLQYSHAYIDAPYR